MISNLTLFSMMLLVLELRQFLSWLHEYNLVQEPEKMNTTQHIQLRILQHLAVHQQVCCVYVYVLCDFFEYFLLRFGLQPQLEVEVCR
jgi:hypothetical protein